MRSCYTFPGRLLAAEDSSSRHDWAGAGARTHRVSFGALFSLPRFFHPHHLFPSVGAYSLCDSHVASTFDCELGASTESHSFFLPSAGDLSARFCTSLAVHHRQKLCSSSCCRVADQGFQAFAPSTGRLPPSFPPGSNLLVQKFSVGPGCSWVFLAPLLGWMSGPLSCC